MSFIKVDNITKTFKVTKRNSGVKAALKSFFKREHIIIDAVKNISFNIKKGEIRFGQKKRKIQYINSNCLYYWHYTTNTAFQPSNSTWRRVFGEIQFKTYKRNNNCCC